MLEKLKHLLEHWAIVGFEYGKLSGAGYNYQLQEDSGEEWGQKFIIQNHLIED